MNDSRVVNTAFKQLPTAMGTRFKVINNKDLGVLTVDKHMIELSANGEKELTHVKYSNSDGKEMGCTPVGLFTSQWFEVVTNG